MKNSFMKKNAVFALAFSASIGASASAWAQGVGTPSYNELIQVMDQPKGIQGSIETAGYVSSDPRFKLLVGVSYMGFSPGEVNPKKQVRYFWVRGRVAYADKLDEYDTTSGYTQDVEAVDVEIAPATFLKRVGGVQVDSIGHVTALPISIRREVPLGMEWSGAVWALGYGFDVQTRLSPTDEKKIFAFAKLAIDFLGYQLVKLKAESQPGHFLNLAREEVIGGVGYQFNETVQFRLSLGVRGSMGFKPAALLSGQGLASNEAMMEGDLFARFEAIFNTALAQITAFAEGGAQLGVGAYAPTEGTVYVGPRVTVGVSARFK